MLKTPRTLQMTSRPFLSQPFACIYARAPVCMCVCVPGCLWLTAHAISLSAASQPRKHKNRGDDNNHNNDSHNEDNDDNNDNACKLNLCIAEGFGKPPILSQLASSWLFPRGLLRRMSRLARVAAGRVKRWNRTTLFDTHLQKHW